MPTYPNDDEVRNPYEMSVEELDKAITDAGLDYLLEELAEIADNVQTKTGWKRSFAPYILSILKETRKSDREWLRGEVEKMKARASERTELFDHISHNMGLNKVLALLDTNQKV